MSAFYEIANAETLCGEVTNVGMNKEISIRTLVEKIAGLLGVEVTIGSDPTRVRPASSEVDRLVCDNTKILTYTNWRPRFNLKDGLYQTIEWFRERTQNYKQGFYYV